MPEGPLSKASIRAVDPAGETVEVMFNPKEYTFTRSLEWKVEVSPGQDVPKAEFMGGQSGELSMSLLFDTYEKKDDVRKIINKLWKFTLVDPSTKNSETDKARPPIVEFAWGSFWTFKAVITELSVRYTMFLPEGKPVRATADVKFKQVTKEGAYPWQNPTSRGDPGKKVRRVRQGETMDWIAFEELRDPTRWRELAELNDIDDPLALFPGQPLIISRS